MTDLKYEEKQKKSLDILEKKKSEQSRILERHEENSDKFTTLALSIMSVACGYFIADSGSTFTFFYISATFIAIYLLIGLLFHSNNVFNSVNILIIYNKISKIIQLNGNVETDIKNSIYLISEDNKKIKTLLGNLQYWSLLYGVGSTFIASFISSTIFQNNSHNWLIFLLTLLFCWTVIFLLRKWANRNRKKIKKVIEKLNQ